MVPRERERYHQLHSATLLTDWATAILAGAMLWKQRWLPAFAIGFVPSIVMTLVFVSGRLDEALERIRRRPVSKRIALGLSAGVNTVRFAGLGVSWAGCWFHHVWMIPTGVLAIVGAWWLAWR